MRFTTRFGCMVCAALAGCSGANGSSSGGDPGSTSTSSSSGGGGESSSSGGAGSSGGSVGASSGGGASSAAASSSGGQASSTNGSTGSSGAGASSSSGVGVSSSSGGVGPGSSGGVTSSSSGSVGPMAARPVWVDRNGVTVGDYLVAAEGLGLDSEGVFLLRDGGGLDWGVSVPSGSAGPTPFEARWVYAASDCTGTRWVMLERPQARLVFGLMDESFNVTHHTLRDNAQPSQAPSPAYVRDPFTSACGSSNSVVQVFAESEVINVQTPPPSAAGPLHMEIRNHVHQDVWMDASGQRLGGYVPMVEVVGITHDALEAIQDDQGFLWSMEPVYGTVGPLSRTAAWVYQNADCTGPRAVALEGVFPRWVFELPGRGSTSLRDGAQPTSFTGASHMSLEGFCEGGDGSNVVTFWPEADLVAVPAFAPGINPPVRLQTGTPAQRVWKDAAGATLGPALLQVDEGEAMETALIQDTFWVVSPSDGTVRPSVNQGIWVWLQADCAGERHLSIRDPLPRRAVAATDATNFEVTYWKLKDNAVPVQQPIASYRNTFNGACSNGAPGNLGGQVFAPSALDALGSPPTGFVGPLHLE